MITDSFKQDLLNRVDIVDVIERYVPLKKAGTNLSACCPFHSEKTPSFTVSPTKQFYHCFGCGAHGNAISFVMEYQGLGYVEAVRDLAEGVGLKLPEYQPQQARKPDAGPDLYALMEQAAKFYREQLKASPRAIDYLKRRGLTGAVAARFGIGYAPDDWQGLEKVFPDYKAKALAEVGLVIDNDSGRRYDRFRDRVMFPILNQRGAIIGFGGRVIDQGEPKYLNSPETPLFEKGRELYGWSQARVAMREAGRALVVEGYMDVVALAQHGVGYAVATLGTATSATHISKLLRQTDEVVFCFDGDAAGRRAAWHALEVSLPLLADHKVLRFLFLPVEDDPDSFIRTHGKEAFEARIAGALPLSEFLLTELKSRVDLATPEGRAKLIHEARPLLSKVAASVMQLQLLKQIAGLADLLPAEAANALGIALATTAKRAPGVAPPDWKISAAPGSHRAAQPQRLYQGKARLMPGSRREFEFLLRVVLVPSLAEKVPTELLTGDSPECRVLARIVRAIESEGIQNTEELLAVAAAEHQAEELIRHLSEATVNSRFADADIRKEFDDALLQMEGLRLKGVVDELLQKQNPSPEEKESLARALQDLRRVEDMRSGRSPVV